MGEAQELGNVGVQTRPHVYGLELISQVEKETATYYLYDGLGSTRQLADDSGDVVATHEYDAFGAVRTHTGATTEWSFTGEQNDANGPVYRRARHYEAAIGRLVFAPTPGWSVGSLPSYVV